MIYSEVHVRTALSDLTLSTGGGLIGKENFEVAKGTHIGTPMTGGGNLEDHFVIAMLTTYNALIHWHLPTA